MPGVQDGIAPARVSVFEFTDYRAYLKTFYEAKKDANTHYSMSTFARKAGLGQNSRGYLKLVIEGKRSLTPHTLRRFVEALGLAAREAMYFENLVYFNQAKTSKDREYY
ncbi:MAG: TIGR02147 family protein, partial [Bdellovibrionota bacterium]